MVLLIALLSNCSFADLCVTVYLKKFNAIINEK